MLDHAVNRLGVACQDGVVLFDRRGCPIRANEHAPLAIAGAGGELDLVGGHRMPELAAARLGRGHAQLALPAWIKLEWVEPMIVKGEHLGSLLVVPFARSHRAPARASATATDIAGPIDDAFASIITGDPALMEAIAKARQLARSKAPVLLQGETGAGKEEFARGIHGACTGPYVALNSGGLWRELLASELFGYAEGAFTGARKGGMVGKIEAANDGTLFLDEIGEMLLDMQPILLRVLEQGEIYRLGENTPRRVNFRLIAATHRDLRKEIAEGRFRMDLYYRIAVTSLRIPPLRERQGDITRLAWHFLDCIRRKQGLEPGTIADDALQALESYSWPGNVRELRNIIEGAVLLSEGTALTSRALPHDLLEAVAAGTGSTAAAGAEVCSIAEGEDALIRRAISASGGNLTDAARQLHIAKSTLYAKMQRYGLSRETGYK